MLVDIKILETTRGTQNMHQTRLVPAVPEIIQAEISYSSSLTGAALALPMYCYDGVFPDTTSVE